MTWVCLPQRLVVQDVLDVAGVWYCREAGRFALVGSGAVVLVGAANLFPNLKVGGDTLYLCNTLYHGNPWFRGSGAFFHSVVRDCWIYRTDGLYEPRSILDPDTGDEIGDGWYEPSNWTFNAFAATFSAVALVAKGTASDSASLEVAWPHWMKGGASSTAYATPLGGTYSPLCGASGTVDLGRPAWRRSSDSAIFLRRTGGSISAPATGAEIIAAASLDDEDVTGDLVFSDAPQWRIRESPTDGSNIAYYTFDGENYARAGWLYAIGTKVVPSIPAVPSGALPYPGGLLAASPPQWI